MHNTMLLLLFVLFVDGVSGAETVPVMEGDSVTLHTGLTEILNDHTIVWKFGPKGSFISEITRENNFTSFSVTDDVGFRGRLQVDQNTGSLTIRNTREKHSGQYQVTISRGKTTSKTFHVTVQRVVSGTDGVKSKSVSVTEGDSVTLNPDKTQIQGDDLMLWRFGDKGILLAKTDVETKETSLYDADERFRDRLELDQTGSLTITNTRTTDAGLYQLQLRGSESLQQFVLTVNQPGLSSGAVAGIVVLVLVAAAAAVAAVIYQRRKISELQKQILTVTETVPVTVSVKEGDPVILEPHKAINKDDEILWMFGDKKQRTGIAEIKTVPRDLFTYDNSNDVDERFRGRLELKETGSLTIRNSRTTHSGLYTLRITSSGGASEQTFILTVKETLEEKSIEDGSVTLDPDPLNPDTEIQGGDLILWMFGDQEDIVIAQVRGGDVEIYDDAAGGIFRGSLQLNKTTGSLTITDITSEHTGFYKLLIISSRGTLCKKFRVLKQLVYEVTAEKAVRLFTGLPKIERDDVIQWMFGDDSLIAEIKGGNRVTHDVPDGRFKGRLQLNNQTGELTILNFTAQHAGRYKLKICSSKVNTNRIYGVTITYKASGKPLMKGKNVGEAVYVNTPLLDK